MWQPHKKLSYNGGHNNTLWCDDDALSIWLERWLSDADGCMDCPPAIKTAMAAFLTNDVDEASWLKLLTIFRPPGPIRGPLAMADLISAGDDPLSSIPAAAADWWSSKRHKNHSSFFGGIIAKVVCKGTKGLSTSTTSYSNKTKNQTRKLRDWEDVSKYSDK